MSAVFMPVLMLATVCGLVSAVAGILRKVEEKFRQILGKILEVKNYTATCFFYRKKLKF